MEEEKLEEGEWTEETQRNSTFKAFALRTPAVQDKAARLAKVEVWKQKMERQKVRKQLMDRVEASSGIQTTRVSAPSTSSARSASLPLSATRELPTAPAFFASSAPPASLATPTSSAPPTKAELKRASRWVQRRANQEKYKVEIAAAKAQRGLEKQMEADPTENPTENGTQSFKARSLTLATPPPPLSSRLVHNSQQGSVDSDTTDMEEREREQDIDEGMHGDTYRGMYGDGYRDANVDMYEENFVSGGPSRGRRRGGRRCRRRKEAKAREPQASLQGHELIPVPLSQEDSSRTISDHDTTALNLNSSDRQRNGIEHESNGKTIRETSSSGTQPRNKRQEQIDASRQGIMALQASSHAKGLLFISPPWLLVKESLSRPLSNSPPAALNPDSDNRQQARGQKTQGNMDENCSGPLRNFDIPKST
ncbi:hypothetical protein OCU04_001640 [Sclerotinia nivalis]|uniref:Uncharacterized protein n=1 Tax=Sclerotinia nivalis TaxID=352851 RepID=A0A9X0AYV1_9HELO|nr:hypothetical protein OCU04_001640 [Sclerotinia nivalis]